MNDAPDTRSALLHAGRRLFARHGYEGASIRAITDAAHANLGAVTYHFGSKEALYEAVLDALATPFLARVRAAATAPATPLDGVEAVVRACFAHLHENPDWPSLLAHELALAHAVPAPLQRTMQGVFGTLTTLVQAGQSDGSIVAGHPVLMTFSVLSQPMYMGLIRDRLRQVFAFDSDDPATRRQMEDHVVAFVRKSLATRQEERRRSS